jgi:predicted Zn-dependent protease
MWKNLKETIDSPEADPDSGPVIVDPALAGAMFYDILMVRLSTGRFLRENDERTFANKLGEQIIPTFLTVVDDPLMQYWQHTFLSGSYPYDDEWVPARRLVMVKDGVLQNFYFSRKPYKDTNRSNGHGRASFFQSPISRPGITLVHSQRSYDLPKLRDMLNQEIKRQGKRYGYILKEFTGTSQVQRSIYSVTPKDIYRLDIKTDRIERVKGLQVRTSASQVLQGIIATGNDYTAFNGSDSEDSGNAQISTVAPSLLINRLVFQRVNIPQKKTFTLPPPFRPVQSPPQPSTAKP